MVANGLCRPTRRLGVSGSTPRHTAYYILTCDIVAFLPLLMPAKHTALIRRTSMAASTFFSSKSFVHLRGVSANFHPLLP